MPYINSLLFKVSGAVNPPCFQFPSIPFITDISDTLVASVALVALVFPVPHSYWSYLNKLFIFAGLTTGIKPFKKP
jgi:hypothetical protein